MYLRLAEGAHLCGGSFILGSFFFLADAAQPVDRLDYYEQADRREQEGKQSVDEIAEVEARSDPI